jgi:hypothetical protein
MEDGSLVGNKVICNISSVITLKMIKSENQRNSTSPHHFTWLSGLVKRVPRVRENSLVILSTTATFRSSTPVHLFTQEKESLRSAMCVRVIWKTGSVSGHAKDSHHISWRLMSRAENIQLQNRLNMCENRVLRGTCGLTRTVEIV